MEKITKEREEKMKKLEKQKQGKIKEIKNFHCSHLNTHHSGITLIALVVTIVILLILAAITINLVLAEGGLFERAQKAGIEQRKAEVLDQLAVAEADVSISAKPIGKPTIREYLKYVYEKGIAVEEDEKKIKENEEYEIYTEDGLVFNIKIKEGTNVNDILINYEGTADNLPIRIYSTGTTIDEQTGLGKVEVALRRAENGENYTYLYKEKDATTDYIGTEGNGTGTTFTYEGLTLGKTYLFKAIVDEEETEPIEVTVGKLAEGISISQDTLAFTAVSQTEILTATITPSDAKNQKTTWTSSNENVVTVNNGIVTALGKGIATITVTTTDGSNLSAACTVAVCYVSDGLVAHFDGIDNTGSGHDNTVTTWKDLSGNGNDAIITGATWKENSLSFDGSGDYATVDITSNAEVTIEVVTKVNSNTNSVSGIAGWGHYSSDIPRIAINYNTDNFQCMSVNSSASEGLLKKYKAIYDTINYMALTSSASTKVFKNFLNGEKVGDFSNANVSTKNTQHLFGIGDWANKSHQYTGANSLIGNIYSVRVYNRALTEDEIMQNYIMDLKKYDI